MRASDTSTTRTGRTASREVRRRQLIEATIESIAERGFSETTLATVTSRVKLSHGIVNFHFKSKDALFVETLGYLAQEHYEHWQSAIKKVGPKPSQQLAAILEADFARAICSPEKIAVWFAFWGQAKYRPAYLQINDAYDKQRTDEIARLCGLIIEDGDYDHIDPVSTARTIAAVVDGLWLNLLLYPKSTTREQSRDDCFTFLSQLFPKHFPRLAEASV